MNRYFIELAYLGSNYHGWQVQPKQKTIQAEIQTALSTLLQTKIEIVGCGRTDAGVHASYFVAHFDVEDKLNEEKLQQFTYQANSILSKDIVIYAIQKVSLDTHARFSASQRKYQYLIDMNKNPFHQQTKTYYRGNLDFDLMNEAASMLLKIDDFETFSKAHSDNKTSICSVTEAMWSFNDEVAKFEISADRFLRNMVRAIVGTLFDLGRNKINLEDYKRIIESKDRSQAGPSAPSEGLYLSNVIYPEELFKSIHRK